MQISTSRPWPARSSTIVAVFTILLAPLAIVAQGAGEPAADSAALPPFLQSALQGFGLETRASPIDRTFAGEMSPRVGQAINLALAAFRAEQYDDARDAIGELTLDKLRPYERGVAEGVLYKIAYAEGDFCEARDHLLNAIESGALTEEAEAKEALTRLEATADVSSCPRGG